MNVLYLSLHLLKAFIRVYSSNLILNISESGIY